MVSMKLLPFVAVVAGIADAAALEARARTCTVELYTLTTQNPVGGGDGTHNCGVLLDYGDGRKEKISTDCYKIVRSNCYNSQLPNQICVHTNHSLEDGYIDYGKEHRDFNEPGCTHTGGANPAGARQGIKCSFPCT